MLYLQQSADRTGEVPPRRIPLGGQTALLLERALLADDRAVRQHAVTEALAGDQDVAGWALRAAESRLGRAINRIDEAADWLCGCVETELAASLISGDSPSPSSGIAWRLPALATKLAACERQRTEFDHRLEQEKLQSLKELAYGASHEINNPLANIAARAQTLLQDEKIPERQRKLAAIHRQAMRAHEMIADLMLFARPPRLEPAPCDLRQVVQRVIEELRDDAEKQEIQIVYERGRESFSTGEPYVRPDAPVEKDSRPPPSNDSLHVVADATQLAVAIKALVINSLEAVGAGGHVSISVCPLESDDAEPCFAQVTVSDDGPGISPEIRRHMFDPFFSGREAGRGLGFGLSKCWRIVTDHGGQVVVNQPAGGGAEIAILVPSEPVGSACYRR